MLNLASLSLFIIIWMSEFELYFMKSLTNDSTINFNLISSNNSTYNNSSHSSIKSTKINPAISTQTINLTIKILSNSTHKNNDLNGTSKVNFNSTLPNQAVSPRTFQLFELNSWIVGKVMGGLQYVFGTTLIPHSKVFFLQTLVNPFYPFTYSKQLVDDFKETAHAASSINSASESAEYEENDYGLSDILDVLKPKLVDGLSELVDSGLLEKLHPIVNLTVETSNNDNDNEQASSHPQETHSKVAYDFVDLNEFKKYYYKANSSFEIDPILDVLLNKRKVSSQIDDAAKLDDVTTKLGSLIDKEEQEPNKSLDKSHLLVRDNMTTIEFRESKQSNISEELNVNQVISQVGDVKYEILPKIVPQTADSTSKDNTQLDKKNEDKTQQTKEDNELKSKDGQSEHVQMNNNNQTIIYDDRKNQTDERLLEPNVDNKINKTQYLHDDLDLDKPIVSLLSCDGDQCEEEVLHKPTSELTNGTQSYEPNKELSKPTGNFTTDFKRLAKLIANGLIIKPATFVKDRLVRLGSIIKRDIRLLFKMTQAMFGFVSSTCRYKFLCLASSFFSLHTPDYVKANMPTAVENYYITIMEAANRHEFLNAIVTGYVGFDCNDFYADKRCPE